MNVALDFHIRQQGAAGKSGPHEAGHIQCREQRQKQTHAKRQPQLPLAFVAAQGKSAQDRHKGPVSVLVPVVVPEHESAKREPQDCQPRPLHKGITPNGIAAQENICEGIQPAVAQSRVFTRHDNDGQQTDKVDCQGPEQLVGQQRQDRTCQQEEEAESHAEQGIRDAVPEPDEAARQQDTENGHSHAAVLRPEPGAHDANEDNRKQYDQR